MNPLRTSITAMTFAATALTGGIKVMAGDTANKTASLIIKQEGTSDTKFINVSEDIAMQRVLDENAIIEARAKIVKAHKASGDKSVPPALTIPLPVLAYPSGNEKTKPESSTEIPEDIAMQRVLDENAIIEARAKIVKAHKASGDKSVPPALTIPLPVLAYPSK